MKKSILSLLLAFMFILTGCEKDSVESVESSGSITDEEKVEVTVFDEIGNKSTLSFGRLINIGEGNRTINPNGCDLDALNFSDESGGVDSIKEYVTCLSVTNFPIMGGTPQTFKSTTHGIWSNEGNVFVVPSIAEAVEGAINNPMIVTKLREDRMNIAGVSVGEVVWPSSATTNTSESLGSFEIFVTLKPRPFIPIF